MSEKNIVLTITGPSLTGKTTCANLLKEHNFEEAVSTTTRPPRAGEIEGVHYNFVTVEEFQKMLSNGEMIESTQVGKNFYGLSRKSLDNVLNKGKNAAVVVEPHGAHQVADFCNSNNLPLFQIYLNNDLKTLLDRFKIRFENDTKADKETYATRLWGVIMEEPINWTAKAVSGEHKYDVVFDEFTPQNQDGVISDLMRSLQIFKKKNNIKIK